MLIEVQKTNILLNKFLKRKQEKQASCWQHSGWINFLVNCNIKNFYEVIYYNIMPNIMPV